MTFSLKNDFKIILAVCVASVLMALNINTFVQTGGLYPGGATGLTILIQRLSEKFLNIHLSFAVVNFLLNMIPIYIGFRYIGKRFTLYSCLMIVLSRTSSPPTSSPTIFCSSVFSAASSTASP